MAGGTGVFQIGTQFPGVLLDLIKFQSEQNVLAGAAAITSISCGGASTYYTQSFPLHRGVVFGWEFKVTSSGVVALTIELEQSNQPPTTELFQDDAFGIPIGKTTTNGLIPSGNIITVGWYKTAYAPIPSVLGRLKLTGTGGNDATTALSVARVYQIKTV